MGPPTCELGRGGLSLLCKVNSMDILAKVVHTRLPSIENA